MIGAHGHMHVLVGKMIRTGIDGSKAPRAAMGAARKGVYRKLATWARCERSRGEAEDVAAKDTGGSIAAARALLQRGAGRASGGAAAGMGALLRM